MSCAGRRSPTQVLIRVNHKQVFKPAAYSTSERSSLGSRKLTRKAGCPQLVEIYAAS